METWTQIYYTEKCGKCGKNPDQNISEYGHFFTQCEAELKKVLLIKKGVYLKKEMFLVNLSDLMPKFLLPELKSVV